MQSREDLEANTAAGTSSEEWGVVGADQRGAAVRSERGKPGDAAS